MNTPSTSPRTLEKKRLTSEANGQVYAPVKGTFFNEARNILIEEYVRKGLEKHDEQRNNRPS